MASFVSSYIPTVASQVTRAADQVSILTSAFGYNAAEGTVAIFGDTAEPTGIPAFASLSDGTTNNRLLHRASNAAQFFCISGGSVVAQLDNGSITANTATGISAAFKLNDFASSLNGSAVTTDSAGAMPIGINILWIGSRGDAAADWTNGHIKRLTYFPTRRTNADLQELTT